jgi:hypothetical protein
MAEWELAQIDPSEELAQLHFFSIKKKQPGGDIEFQIVVREYAAPLDREQNRSMRFFAQANRQTNQSIAAYTPSGWGSTLGAAVSQCVKEIRRFPYEGPMADDDAVPAS